MDADGVKPIREVFQERNIPEATYHRWRKQFGLMEVDEAKRLKELERENSELKKMAASSLLKNSVLEAVCKNWTRERVWEAINARLRALVRGRIVKRSRPTAAILDSQEVKSDPHGGVGG